MKRKKLYTTPRATSIAFHHEADMLAGSGEQSLFGENHSHLSSTHEATLMEERPVKGEWWE